MPMEILLKLIEKLRDRIQRHSSALRQNEMLTRYVLVDSLLRELGWDTEDPEQVRPEYRSGSGSSDYALISGAKAVMMIEAKKLDESLQGGLQQAIQYCLTEGTPYFAVTDGRRWEIYETHKAVPLAQKQVASFDLGAEALADVVLKIISLWRPSVETGTLKLPSTPVLTGVGNAGIPARATSISVPGAATSRIRLRQFPNISAPATPPSWIPLPQLRPRKGDKAPQSLRLPDGSERPLGKWVNLPLETVRWFSDKRILTPTRCPIRYGSRYLVSITPVHSDGKPFTGGKQVGDFHVEANYNGADQVRNTRLIISHLSQDEGQFSVRF
jgi:hypothetical protein